MGDWNEWQQSSQKISVDNESEVQRQQVTGISKEAGDFLTLLHSPDPLREAYRIYCLGGLNLRRKHPRRHVSAAHRQQRPILTGVDQCWRMDFVSDSLFNGRRFRALTVVDNISRVCLALHAGKSLKGEDVVGVMDGLRVLGKRPTNNH